MKEFSASGVPMLLSLQELLVFTIRVGDQSCAVALGRLEDQNTHPNTRHWNWSVPPTDANRTRRPIISVIHPWIIRTHVLDPNE